MSTTVLSSNTSTITESPIDIGKFCYKDVNYSDNCDLFVQLRKGGNIPSGEIEGGIVVVKVDVDGCQYNAVEVQRGSHYDSGTEVDVIDAAIASLIVARDTLRKIEAAAA